MIDKMPEIQVVSDSIPVFYQVLDRTRIGTETSHLVPEIDNPTHRSIVNGLPSVTRSALRGAFRDMLKETEQENGHTAGDVWLGKAGRPAILNPDDAEILFLPVRSFLGPFCWATCPTIINRWLSNIGRSGDVAEYPQLSNPLAAHIPLDSELLESNQSITIAEQSFKAEVGLDSVQQLIALLQQFETGLFSVNSLENIAVFHDQVFCEFCLNELLIIPRNSIDTTTGIVSEGPWYEEYIPEQTIFQGVIDIDFEPLLNQQNLSPIDTINKRLSRLNIGSQSDRGIGTLRMSVAKTSLPANKAIKCGNVPDCGVDLRLLRVINRVSIKASNQALDGIVDQPLFKDRTTQLPILPESSLRGSLRFAMTLTDNTVEIQRLFGSDNSAGVVRLRDAQLLFFPLRSNANTYINLTSRSVIRHFLEQMSRYSDEYKHAACNLIPNPRMCDLLTSSASYKEPTHLGIGKLTPVFCSELQSLKDLMCGYDLAVNKHPIGVVRDEIFRNIVKYQTVLVSRISLDESGESVAFGPWNEECVPAETIFWMTESTNHFQSNANHPEVSGDNLPEFLRIGAYTTGGSGFIEILKNQDE